ncbi:ATP-grasp domain-containing protein [Halapricum sp. CBA1109]|uniref:ATP-grasp domain-containing protein n=1 Tax=Halapricum sp. CBA1109 TaxID=2668068 RepID=UPI0012FA45D7|nr:RimK family alpha-L-glutamate ligase [Halapricum sp. CBA1109]MUV89022.1 ATP-grasp domain-containing protein [Halapricum sp. CBA1109]
MLTLAITTQAETFERMGDPLAERGIDAVAVQPEERTLSLTGGDPLPDADVGFVYPSRIMEGGVVDAMLDVPWVNDREAILRSRNKADVLTRLSAAGVPVPETTMVSNPVDDEAVAAAAERFDPPIVVKPNSTTRGTGVTKVSDLDSLLGVTDYLDLVQDYRATGDRSYLLQEYLPDARDYRVMVLDGEYVGAVERRLPADARARGQWKHNVHRGAEASAVDLAPELRELAERAAAVLDIDYLGVDLLVTEERALVGETNARPTIDSAEKYEDGFWDDLAGLIRARAGE